MADVVVKISGDNKDLKRTLSESEEKLSRFGGKAKQAGSDLGGFGTSTQRATGVLQRFGGVMAGGLGIGLATTGLKIFESIAIRSMERARREAALTQAAFESALSAAVNVDIPTQSFDITNRDQAVELGRDAAARLRQVRTELDDSLLRFERAFPGIQGTAEKTLAIFAAAGNDAAQQELARLNLLKQQEARLQSEVDFYTQITEKLTQANKLAQQLSSKGLSATDPRTPAQIARDFLTSGPAPVPDFVSIIPDGGPRSFQDFGRNFFENITPPPDLPDNLKRTEDQFDKLSLKLLNLGRAARAGVVPALDAMGQEAQILQQQLEFLIASGVDPMNADFQETLARLSELRGQMQTTITEVNGGALALKLIGDVGVSALSGLVFQFEQATDAAGRFRNVLRSIGQRIFQVGLGAALNVGIGALTGNPLSFGQALAGAVGLPTGSSGVSSTDTLSAASIANSGARPSPIRVEVVGSRLSGGDLLLSLQEAQQTRGVGGVTI